MKKALFWMILITISGLMIFTGCGEDSTGPDDNEKQIGWAVGLPSDGYGTIVHTKDGGVTWERQGDTLSIPNTSLHEIRALNSSIAWAVGDVADDMGTILKTTDGGENWIRIDNSRNIPNVGISGVSIIDENKVWVVGSSNTVLYTDDGGSSWTSKSDAAYDQLDLSEVVAVNQDNIWICGGINDGLILHSTDGGDSWISEGDSTLLNGHQLISFSAVNHNHAWTVGGRGTVLRTLDGGNNWEEKSPNPGVVLDANGVCALNETTVWVVMDYGTIYLTQDNGETWSQQVSNASGYYMLRVCALDENTAWVSGYTQSPPIEGIILHTTDGGQTWNQIDYGTDSGLWDIYFVDSYH